MEVDEAIGRLVDERNMVNVVHLPYFRGGRGDGERNRGHKNLPESMRVMIGALARMSTSAEVSRAFGMDYHHVHDLKHGIRGDNTTDVELKKKVENKVKDLHEDAVDRMMAFLGICSADEAKELGVVDKVSLAKDMSIIMKNLRPAEGMSVEAKAQVVVMTAAPKSESAYGQPILIEVDQNGQPSVQTVQHKG